MKAKNYKPFGGGVSKKTISRAAVKAAKRAEDYSFKSRNGAPGDVGMMISSEMRSLADERSSLLDPSISQDRWTDRSSLLAAPVQASDMYLMCDRASGSVVFNGPRYYGDELAISAEDPVSGMPQPPSISRFPYSDEAHAASKKLAAKLAKNLARRHYAAAVMQRSYRSMIAMRNFRKEVQDAQMACRKLQWFWRKRLFRTRERRALWKLQCKFATIIQCMVRCWAAHRCVRRTKARKLRYAIVTISRFFIYVKRELKRRRGRRVRMRVHATRIQALQRGKMGRRRIRRMHWAWQRIRRVYLNWWLRKKGKHGKVLYHFLRRRIIYRAAQRFQSVVRGFFGRGKFQRNRLKYSAYERHRQTHENELVASELLRDVREACYSWVVQPPLGYGNELPRDSAKEIMRCLDVSSRCILYPSKDKNGAILERRIQAIDAELNLDEFLDNSRRSISLAVLSSFANRPSGMIDYIALEACKPYLTPVRIGRTVTEDEAWAELQSKPMVSILAASALLEPTMALRCRVTVQGHLPDVLLAQAAIVRRWTHHTDYIVKRAIWKERNSQPTKYQCPDCLEAVRSPEALRHHLPCTRLGWPSWISRKSYEIQCASLQNRICALKAYPPVVRLSIEEDRKIVAMKVSSRRELAKKRGAGFLSIREREDYVANITDAITNLDPYRKLDKRALRLARQSKISGEESLQTPSKASSQKRSPGKNSPTSQKASPKSSPGSMKTEGSSIVVPPAGVDFIPFFEEYHACAADQIAELTEDDWLKKPGAPGEKPVTIRDKEDKVVNFEMEPHKALKKSLKKEAKKKAASAKK